MSTQLDGDVTSGSVSARSSSADGTTEVEVEGNLGSGEASWSNGDTQLDGDVTLGPFSVERSTDADGNAREAVEGSLASGGFSGSNGSTQLDGSGTIGSSSTERSVDADGTTEVEVERSLASGEVSLSYDGTERFYVNSDVLHSESRHHSEYGFESETTALEAHYGSPNIFDVGVKYGTSSFNDWLGDGRFSTAAEANIVSNDITLGGTENGNHLTFGASLGAGHSNFTSAWEDTDGDGQKELAATIPLSINGVPVRFPWVIAGLGGTAGFRFEPEAVLNRAREFLGMPREENSTFVRQMSNPEQSLGMRRLDEAFERLQSLC